MRSQILRIVVSHWILILALMATIPSSGEAQVDAPLSGHISRAELVEFHDWFGRAANSSAYSDALRQRAQERADDIQLRLEEGDFNVGDRIPLLVDGEITLSDTFTVAPGRVIRFEDLGEMSLKGVLRAELDDRLVEFLGRFLREPRLSSTPLIRVTIEGAVGAQGFYNLPSITPIAEALMVAGIGGSARLQDAQIIRDGKKIWAGDSMRRALAMGRTLGQLNLRPGDRIVMPESFPLGNAQGAVRTFTLLLGIPFAILALIGLFT